ncbi:C40 family peptidase [Pradoshia sp.]|uniref:C40 family peptidase n=1 Tax=Pradoshia sp. TaxID=2651281 RepID=UPI003F05960C
MDGMHMQVAVSVATVWTSSAAPRELDRPVISHPARISEWLMGMTLADQLDLHDSNRIQTQVLFGEHVIVTKVEGDWASILVPGQPTSKNEKGYPGWVPLRQLRKFQNVEEEKGTAIIKSKTALLKIEGMDSTIPLCYQTELPLINAAGNTIKVLTPLGKGELHRDDVHLGKPAGRKSGEDICRSGERFIGLPYLWGGVSSYGYDCSGFAYTMLKANGFTAARDAADQARGGREVSLDAIKPGDLLFFAYEEGKGAIHHVGIYHGNGRLLHSPKTGKSIESILLEGTIYEGELCCARRYYEEAGMEE